jgi:anti-sigma factor RsiW
MAQHNDHQQAEELFSAYIDQHVTADEKTFVERHVAVCADCRAKLAATRAMVAALHTLPMVKAPRSFVLPREMERQPRRSILTWYPALRLATAAALVAFVLVFAGDLLRAGTFVANVPNAAAPASQAMEAPAAPQAAPPTAPVAKLAAPSSPAPQATYQLSMPAVASGAANQSTPTSPTATAPATEGAGAAADRQLTVTTPATVTLPLVAAAAPTIEATPPVADRSAAGQPSAGPSPETRFAQSTAPATDPLRVLEIALAVLVIVLLAATLIARRRTT